MFYAIEDLERYSLSMRLSRSTIVGDTVIRVRSIPEGIVGEEIVVDVYGSNPETTSVTAQDNKYLTISALAYAHEADVAVGRTSLSPKISDAITTTPVNTDMIPFERVDDTSARHMTVAALFDRAIVFNDSGANVDFRFEGDTSTNLLRLDAGNDNITINAAAVSAHYDLMLAGDGVLGLKETTTPTADDGYGKLYTKLDNVLYFQSGDGVEHIVAYSS